MILGENHMTLQKPWGSKISLKHLTVSKINDGKTIFGKDWQMTLWIPCGSNISSKLLYLAPFLRYIRFFIFIVKKNHGVNR